MKKRIVIPARFASSRLPGKPLLDINGQPLIWHVYQNALRAGFESIVVATDHPAIIEAVQRFDGEVILTDPSHVNGTDRIAEVCDVMGYANEDIIVNLQGDEPMVLPTLIRTVANALESTPNAGLATLCSEIHEQEMLFNPNVVKVIKTVTGNALYFSRAPIPWDREQFPDLGLGRLRVPYYRHIGLYAYKVDTLAALSKLPESYAEHAESLEQLRALENNILIQVEEVKDAPHHGIDTAADYTRVKMLLEQKNETT
jgi:3-deoxy-manno-octulosonate cytidylyltransferase (CMP-KDO synthetase)